LAEKVYKIKIKDGTTEIELEGDKKFVNESFEQVKKVLGTKNKTTKKKSKSRKKRGRKKKPGRKPKKKPKKTPKKDRIDLRNLSLKEIFDLKKPRRKRHHVMIMAYYMNKALRKREFRATDLKPLYEEVEIETPKNLSYFLRKMADEEPKLLTHGRKQGRYKITDKGIDYIYDEIPDAK